MLCYAELSTAGSDSFFLLKAGPPMKDASGLDDLALLESRW
jgi:hypothetical protein